MALDNFNPNRVIAPSIRGGAQSILLGRQGTNDALTKLGLAIDEVGRGMRSKEISDMLSSGKLKGKSAEEVNAILTGLSQGDVGKRTQSNIENLVKNKVASEASDLANKRALERLGLEQSFKQGLAEDERNFKSGQNRLDRIMQGEIASDNRYLQRDLENIRHKNAMDMLLNTPAKSGTFEKITDKSVAEKFVGSPDFTEEQTKKVEKVFDRDNLIFDAEFTDQKDKDILNEIAYRAVDTKEGRKAAAGDKAGWESYVKKQLAKRGQAIDEGLFGGMKIIDTKKDNSIFDLFN